MKKICSKCKLEKEIEEFGECKTNKDGFQYYCKECRKLNYSKNKDKIKEKNKKYREKNKKKISIRDKKYREKNKDKYINYGIEYRKKRKDYFKIYFKEYYHNNREHIIEYQVKYRRTKRRIDINIKLREIISKTINRYLHKYFSSKNNSSIFQYLSYSIQELKQHLESQFEPWMNWENYGMYKIDGERKWNIDHIVPQSKLPYDSMDHPNFQKCWALENLRPLDALENIRKGNKFS